MNLVPGITRTKEDLYNILALQQVNLKQNISTEEKSAQGFLTMHFSMELLSAITDLAPSIVIRDEDDIVAYAIVLLQDGRSLYPELEPMFSHLENCQWKDKEINQYSYYVMGQICVSKSYRGNNLVSLLYHEHRRQYESQFDFIVTEISTSNIRSLKAHAKVGFKLVDTYRDHLDEWNVVLWDWKDPH
jgi:hypothetical protein